MVTVNYFRKKLIFLDRIVLDNIYDNMMNWLKAFSFITFFYFLINTTLLINAILDLETGELLGSY